MYRTHYYHILNYLPKLFNLDLSLVDRALHFGKLIYFRHGWNNHTISDSIVLPVQEEQVTVIASCHLVWYLKEDEQHLRRKSDQPVSDRATRFLYLLVLAYDNTCFWLNWSACTHKYNLKCQDCEIKECQN